jgi:hypothetical protein
VAASALVPNASTVMTDFPADTRSLIAKCIRMLSSDKDGDIIAAGNALVRVLRSAGADVHDLAEQIEKPNGVHPGARGGKISDEDMQRLYNAGYEAGLQAAEDKFHAEEDDGFASVNGMPSWHVIARWCQRHQFYPRLRDHEREFIDKMAGQTVWREPSEKQQKWLKSIFFKLGGRL